MATYDKGDRVRLSTVFRDIEGTLKDPTTITIRYKDPSGTVTVVTYPTSIIKDGVGQYRLDIDPDEEGTWYYRWEGTGTVVAAGESSFVVRSTQF